MNNDQQNSGLSKKVEDIEYKSNKGSFSTLEVLNKNFQVNGFIRMKNFTAAPTTANVGDLIVLNGVLKLCTTGGTSPVFTTVGTQT